MLAFFIPVLWKVLEWSLVTAAVLTYIQLDAPGADAVNAIVGSFKNVLLDVDWSSLASNIGGHLQNLASSLVDGFLNSDVADTEKLKDCADKTQECLLIAGK